MTLPQLATSSVYANVCVSDALVYLCQIIAQPLLDSTVILQLMSTANIVYQGHDLFVCLDSCRMKLQIQQVFSLVGCL